MMFQPEVEEPLKTLEVSLGGSVSPVDALGLLSPLRAERMRGKALDFHSRQMLRDQTHAHDPLVSQPAK